MATENKKALVFAVLDFLQKSCDDKTISAEDTEGIEVAIQCIGEAFGVDREDAAQQALYSTKPANLLSIFEVYLKTKSKAQVSHLFVIPQTDMMALVLTTAYKTQVSEEEKKQAEEFKAAGNRKVAERNYPEAIKLYTQAIELNGTQAVYFANRAAAYSQQGDHQSAVDDAKQAMVIDPKYTKAYSRMGHALFCQGKFSEAVEAYEKGLELDPENPTLKTSLQTAMAKASSSAVDKPQTRDIPSPAGGMPDLSSMLNNPNLMNMAQQMMQSGALGDMMNNPEIARMAQQMMGGGGAGGGGLAEMMRNPEMMNMARQFMGGMGGNNSNDNGNSDSN
ncbi:hypothetical protein BDF14DRAFT_1720976 [Spinellus fusiger]|nr:hypothetical protein BDF14DRAFT_1720976 [Spinellus fusiger]